MLRGRQLTILSQSNAHYVCVRALLKEDLSPQPVAHQEKREVIPLAMCTRLIDDLWSPNEQDKVQQISKRTGPKWLKFWDPEYKYHSVHYLGMILWQEVQEDTIQRHSKRYDTKKHCASAE